MKCSDGSYVDVPYMRDAVLVNLGAHMQKWTADVYRAAVRLLEFMFSCVSCVHGVNTTHLIESIPISLWDYIWRFNTRYYTLVHCFCFFPIECVG